MRIRTGYKAKLRSERTPEEKAAQAAWIDLRKVTQEEWMERIMSLSKKSRATIARIVWWDFGANRTVANRWNQFDHWLKWDQEAEDNPISSKKVASCLKKVGYPDYRIKLRLMAFQ